MYTVTARAWDWGLNTPAYQLIRTYYLKFIDHECGLRPQNELYAAVVNVTSETDPVPAVPASWKGFTMG